MLVRPDPAKQFVPMLNNPSGRFTDWSRLQPENALLSSRVTPLERTTFVIMLFWKKAGGT